MAEHGRLIDADAIIYYESIDSDTLEGTGKFFAPRELINAMPTIEERKKGKWVSTDDGWDGEYFVCSACGCPWTFIEGSPEDNGINFCPNCGADMRGE